MFVGLVGLEKSGKQTVAEILKEQYGFEIIVLENNPTNFCRDKSPSTTTKKETEETKETKEKTSKSKEGDEEIEDEEEIVVKLKEVKKEEEDEVIEERWKEVLNYATDNWNTKNLVVYPINSQKLLDLFK
jgi:dephospho-CoA kinase